MKNNFNQPVSAVRFRRFTRAAYAVFASLSKVINIGNLAVCLTKSSDRKVSGFTFEEIKFRDVEQLWEDFADAENQELEMLIAQTQLVVDGAAGCFIINRTKYCGG